MKYKLIAADFDDTILHDDHTVSLRFLEAVKDYEAKGGKFIIATGRMPSAIINMIRELGLKGEVLSLQGSVISDIETGQILDTTTLSVENAVKICKYLDDRDIYHHIYQDNNVIAKNVCEYNEWYANISGSELIVLGYPLHQYIRETSYQPTKILIMEHPSKIFAHIDELKKVFGDIITINTSKKNIIEILSKSIDKGIAIAKIAEKYGIKQQEIIAIGDSMNDVPMLTYAGLGVVVKNGSKEAFEVADLIAPSNNDDGVAYVIRKYGLEEDV